MGVLAELIFPLRCAGCGRPGAAICPRCRGDVWLIEPSRACGRCGAPGTGGPCRECGDRAFAFEGARCAGVLSGPLARAVVLYKDSGERRYAALLGALAAQAAGDWLAEAVAIVPVPASRGAVSRRGFDHVLGIAQTLGTIAGVPVAEALRARTVRDQRELGRAERFANRLGSFEIRRGATPPRTALLLDDVFTTGATLDAAAHALRAAGSVRVRALAVARACDRDRPG